MNIFIALNAVLLLATLAAGERHQDAEHSSAVSKNWEELQKKIEEVELVSRLQKRGLPSLTDIETSESAMMIHSCEVQKSVLARLRDLVIMSISQVKACMAQRDSDSDKSKYNYYSRSGDSMKSLQDFDSRLLTI